MRLHLLIVSFLLSLLGIHPAAAVVVFSDSLTSTTLNPNLGIRTSAGYSVALTSEGAVFSKQTGIGNGYAEIVSNFTFWGDFALSVHLDNETVRSNDLETRARAGLAIIDTTTGASVLTSAFGQTGTATVFGIWDSCCFDFSSGSFPNELAETAWDCCFTFKLAAGTGTTSPAASNPLKLVLFLLQEFDNTHAHTALFTNVSLTAENVSSNFIEPSKVPEPNTASLLITFLVLFCLFCGRRLPFMRTLYSY